MSTPWSLTIARGTEPVCFAAFRGYGRPPEPNLPAHVSLPAQPNTPGGDRVRFFTVSATSGSGRYRVRASEEAQHPGYMLLIAQPLRTEDSTLHRLFLIEQPLPKVSWILGDTLQPLVMNLIQSRVSEICLYVFRVRFEAATAFFTRKR